MRNLVIFLTTVFLCFSVFAGKDNKTNKKNKDRPVYEEEDFIQGPDGPYGDVIRSYDDDGLYGPDGNYGDRDDEPDYCNGMLI